MKKLMTILFISTLALTALAAPVEEEKDSHKDIATRLLIDNAHKIKMEGDVEANESFKDVKENLTNFFSNIFDSLPLFGSDDEDELPTNIDNLEYDCTSKTKCFLTLKLTSGEKVTYNYSVKLNSKQEPIAIEHNKVQVKKAR